MVNSSGASGPQQQAAVLFRLGQLGRQLQASGQQPFILPMPNPPAAHQTPADLSSKSSRNKSELWNPYRRLCNVQSTWYYNNIYLNIHVHARDSVLQNIFMFIIIIIVTICYIDFFHTLFWRWSFLHMWIFLICTYRILFFSVSGSCTIVAVGL